MRIFISFSSRQDDLAQSIHLKLDAVGYDTFYASEEIRAGDGYDQRIRDEVDAAERMIFLATKDSLAEGCYALTELRMAQQKWPNPAGRVMTVLVDDTRASELPPYLGAVTSAFKPRGEPAAEITSTVIRTWPLAKVKPRTFALAAAATLALLLGGYRLFDVEPFEPTDPSEKEDPPVTPEQSATPASPTEVRILLENLAQEEQTAYLERIQDLLGEMSLDSYKLRRMLFGAGIYFQRLAELHPEGTGLPKDPDALLEELACLAKPEWFDAETGAPIPDEMQGLLEVISMQVRSQIEGVVNELHDSPTRHEMLESHLAPMSGPTAPANLFEWVQVTERGNLEADETLCELLTGGHPEVVALCGGFDSALELAIHGVIVEMIHRPSFLHAIALGMEVPQQQMIETSLADDPALAGAVKTAWERLQENSSYGLETGWTTMNERLIRYLVERYERSLADGATTGG